MKKWEIFVIDFWVSIFFGIYLFSRFCYMIILYLLVQFDPIMMQINPEIQGSPGLLAPHDRVNRLAIARIFISPRWMNDEKNDAWSFVWIRCV